MARLLAALPSTESSNRSPSSTEFDSAATSGAGVEKPRGCPLTALTYHHSKEERSSAKTNGKTVRTDRRRDGHKYGETRPPTPPTIAQRYRRQCPRYRARFHNGAAARRSQGRAGRACPSSNRCARSIAPRRRSPPPAQWSGIVSTVAAWDASSVSPSDSRARVSVVKRKSRPGPSS